MEAGQILAGNFSPFFTLGTIPQQAGFVPILVSSTCGETRPR